MTKVTHTHRGHCQLCARVIAIDTQTGRIAKHGYKVAQHGMFVGICPGSDVLSLHVERSMADRYIADARRRAADALAFAVRLREGKAKPAQAWNGEYKRVLKPTRGWPDRTVEEKVIIPFADASPDYQRRAVAEFVEAVERDARVAHDYANDLEDWASRITGKVDAYRVEDLEPREWKVGDTVRIGGKGKDGFDAVIEAIENRPYRSFGFSRGSSTTMAAHARLTRPARPEKRGRPDKLDPQGRIITEGRPEKILWEPLRNIKRPSDAISPLAEQLKKAGKL